MVDQRTNPTGDTSDVAGDFAAAGGRLKDEGKALSETMGEAKDAVAAQARDLKDQAADRLGAEAASVKEEAAAGLTAFSDALRTASSELSGKQLGFAGDMVQQAADGLEELRARHRGPVAGRDARRPPLVRAPEPGRLHRGLGARRLRPRPACRRGAGGSGLDILRRSRAGPRAERHADRRPRRRRPGHRTRWKEQGYDPGSGRPQPGEPHLRPGAAAFEPGPDRGQAAAQRGARERAEDQRRRHRDRRRRRPADRGARHPSPGARPGPCRGRASGWPGRRFWSASSSRWSATSSSSAAPRTFPRTSSRFRAAPNSSARTPLS